MVARSRLVIAFLSCVMLLSVGCKKDLPDTQHGDLNSVMGTVGANPELSTLLALITAAGVEDELQGKNDKTLLAPTNAAFVALGQETFDSLMLPANKAQLQEILRNHIIDGSVTAPELASDSLGVNLLGTKLETGKDDTGATTIAGARVIRSIRAADGYVHVIDEVILPVAPTSTAVAE